MVWGYEGWSIDRLISEGIPFLRQEIQAWSGCPLYVGEWSVATNIESPDPDRYRQFIKLYFQTLNEAKAGYTYWTWKISGDT
jgi:hypothetical protein